MIDFHSHVLPAIDDGAPDVDTAVAMLRLAAEQGAETVVATPHFYGDRDTVESFLAKRQRSYEALLPRLSASLPGLRLGAEVLLREGLSRQELRPLCIQGTDILLVEMPFYRLPYWLLEEVENIALGQRLTVMLAHLDRYTDWLSAEDLATLLELPGLTVQFNAGALADKRRLRRLQKWMPAYPRLVLGSDMHNTADRAPRLEEAVRLLGRSRKGRDWLACMQYTAKAIGESDMFL